VVLRLDTVVEWVAVSGTAEPVADIVAELVVDIVAEPVVDIVVEPVVDIVVEPVVDIVADSGSVVGCSDIEREPLWVVAGTRRIVAPDRPFSFSEFLRYPSLAVAGHSFSRLPVPDIDSRNVVNRKAVV